jgi:hypothetical protein
MSRSIFSELSPLLVLSFMLAGATSCVSPMQSGMQSFRDGDPMSALGYWRPLAEDGDENAQYLVGLIYEGLRAGAEQPRPPLL